MLLLRPLTPCEGWQLVDHLRSAHHRKTHQMATNQNRASLIAASIGLSILALTGCVSAAPPAPAPATTSASVLQEDDPGWDCATMGNKVCGTPSESENATAWNVWESGRGPSKLRLDPSRPYRVEYVGRYSSVPPTKDGEVALTGKDGDSYLFRVHYTDGK